MTKLNKQGVRDLGHGRRPDFGKNEMPPELASKLLAPKVAEFGPPLTAEEQEFLEILAEECAETIQRTTKVLRFGIRTSPWDGKDTVERLEAEIGDICAALDVLELLGIIDSDRVKVHADRKLRAFVVEEDPVRPRLRHITPALRTRIAKFVS